MSGQATDAPRRIAVVTTARSDYGIYRPLLRAIADDPLLRLQLIVGASHLDPRFGDTVGEIEADGFEIAERVAAPLDGDGPVAISRVMGTIALGMASAFGKLAPHLIVSLGDRYEMHAAVAAAVPFLIPIAHIAGGAVTQGAIDDGFRHAISKLSHLHFPETEAQKQRLMRMGEEAWRIHVAGSLSIDNALAIRPLALAQIATRLSLPLREPPLLVTLHPETRRFADTADHARALLSALERQPLPVVFTYPGADTSGGIIIGAIEEFVRRNPARVFAVRNMGTEVYFSLMSHARAMVGNSSSGIIEAASFRLPVVNIGSRQAGRMAPRNVIQADFREESVSAAIATAISTEFRSGLATLSNPYGSGDAAARILAVLKRESTNDRLLVKGDF